MKKPFTAVAAITAVFAALAVSPATAAGGGGSTGCGAGIFSSLDSIAGSTARGDEAREPELTETTVEVPANAKGTDGVTGNVTQEQIDAQMTVLNLAFAGFYGGVKTGFSFTLAGVTRSVNADWYYAGPTTTGERAMKKALRVGGFETLNYYSTTAGPYLGWAYFPGLSPGTAYLDGIVVDWESMPGTSTRYADRYDLGQTATHEAGHWVGLHHTFNGGCNNWGDYVEDTPPQLTPTNGCPEGQDSCKEPGLDPIHNYMDYSYDSCYEEFTAGQTARAQDQYLFHRA